MTTHCQRSHFYVILMENHIEIHIIKRLINFIQTSEKDYMRIFDPQLFLLSFSHVVQSTTKNNSNIALKMNADDISQSSFIY